MTQTETAARAAAEKICHYVSECRATNTAGDVGDIAEVITPLLAARDATIDAMEKTVVELQRQVDELKREYSELEAAIERHY